MRNAEGGNKTNSKKLPLALFTYRLLFSNMFSLLTCQIQQLVSYLKIQTMMLNLPLQHQFALQSVNVELATICNMQRPLRLSNQSLLLNISHTMKYSGFWTVNNIVKWLWCGQVQAQKVLGQFQEKNILLFVKINFFCIHLHWSLQKLHSWCNYSVKCRSLKPLTRLLWLSGCI